MEHRPRQRFAKAIFFCFSTEGIVLHGRKNEPSAGMAQGLRYRAEG
jgi:hypothetical protein